METLRTVALCFLIMVINGLNSAAYFDVVHASYFLRKTLFSTAL
jgi:hypothetical protein